MSRYGVDPSGGPQTFLTYSILELLYDPPWADPDPHYTPSRMSKLLAASVDEVNTVLFHLLDDRMVVLEGEGTFRFNHGAEKAKINRIKGFSDYVNSPDGTPAHEILPYSPSFPYRYPYNLVPLVS